MVPDSTRSEMSRLATVGPNRFSMCRSSRFIRRAGRLYSLELAPTMPSSSWGMYQIWVSVASSPSSRNTDPSWKLSGPVNRFADPSAKALR